jgi:hypothetical protein
LRLDQGGDFVTTAALMKRLPTLTDSIEHVCDIRVPYTFDDYKHLRDPLLAIAMSLASDATSQH